MIKIKMTLKTKILLTIIPTFLYLGVPKNYSSAIEPSGEENLVHLTIDSLNAENKKKSLERMIQLEEARKKTEFDTTIYEPVYLNKNQLDKYVDSIYSQKIAPTEISKELFKKMIHIESSYNANAFKKSTGARGLGQLLKSTWEEIDSTSYRENVYNPKKNLEVSLKYLKRIKIALNSANPEFSSLPKQEKLKYIIASYNWGIGNLEKSGWNLNKVPKDTKDYFIKMGLN